MCVIKQKNKNLKNGGVGEWEWGEGWNEGLT